MLHHAHRQTSPWRILVLAALAAALGCGDRPTEPRVDGVSLAKGGNGGGGGLKVRETDPDSAPQDTTLDVRVLGSGFEPGAVATFLLDGVATDGVRTNSTQFVSAKELVANITIAVDAIIDLYDVEVLLAGPEVLLAGPGRRGIGADLFAVVEKGPAEDPQITVAFMDRTGDNIRSDGHAIFDNVYEDGVCNVDATFNVGDARLFLKGKINKKERATCGDPRRIQVDFSDPVEGSQSGGTVEATFFKVDGVEQVTGTALQTAVIGGAGCAHQLLFNSELDSQSDDVTVTKNADGTWTVATKDSPDNVAVCIPDETKANPPQRSYYHMPFSITVSLK